MLCPYGKALLQRLAPQQLRGDERLAFIFIDVVNGADVGVMERRSGVGLT